MLRKILIENFYSIKEAQVLDLGVPNNVPDLPGFGVNREISPVRISQVISIFGANASGKTTILRAIGFLRWFFNQFISPGPNRKSDYITFLRC